MNIHEKVFQATWDAAMRVAKEQKELSAMTGISEPALSKMKERKSLSFENFCKLLAVATQGGFNLNTKVIALYSMTAVTLHALSDTDRPNLLISLAKAGTAFVLCYIAGIRGLIHKAFLADRMRTNLRQAASSSLPARYAQ